MSAHPSVKSAAKGAIRSMLPLSARKRLCVLISRMKWIKEGRRHWWSTELLRDFAERDINGYHKFLWANHLSYAATYEPSLRFGEENMRESRRLFFSDLQGLLESMGIDPSREIGSVFELGCSLGYQLRHIETSLFPNASIIEGLDIDRYAIESGREHLSASGSKVELYCSDMESFEDVTGAKVYDIIICSGVLMYLSEEPAARLVRRMLKHTGKVLAFSGLAHRADNSGLKGSVVRERDGTFVHNIDGMVKSAGGRILQRRWDGGRIIDGNTIYFVFATS